jgi:uncharacterized phage protein (TIGR02218 family)
MRSIPATLASKLDEGVTTLALAWRLTRTDGVIVALTQHDRDLTFDNTTFVAAQAFLGSDQESQLNLSPNRTALSGALTIEAISEADLALGRWDGAKVEAFWVDWTSPTDFIRIWLGIVAGATWRGSVFELDVVGPEAVLNKEIGRVYARTCDATLGDGRCKVNLAVSGRTLSATISAVSCDRSVTCAIPAGSNKDDFIGGVITLTDGPATSWRADVTRIEVSTSAWRIYLSRPFPIAPASGNGFSLTMGCDKSFATCKARFANALNFRGQPTLPGDDVAFAGPAAGGNDGGKR